MRSLIETIANTGPRLHDANLVGNVDSVGIRAQWRCVALIATLLAGFELTVSAASFVHPGLLQTRQDLELMKRKVAAGEEPWKTAWANLRTEPYSSTNFHPRPVTHIFRGSFGRAGSGDRDLTDGANAAYSQAIQWVVTGDKTHARKAIEIINAWSGTLWDFQGNDAKLLAGWTGHVFCNAAEILRATDSGWEKKDVAQFKRMLLTVYHPLIKDYFQEANGNWDAAMMDTMLSIGIFCDDRAIFDSAVNHYLRGGGNGGVTKYVYPSGQCEESARDQGHTQLGLGELAQACQVAWSQGVDLYGAADNRLALGFEYTARYMLGEDVPAYGVVSSQGRGRFSDVYEPIYQHFHLLKGLEMPATERALAASRAGRSWNALTFYHGPPARPAVSVPFFPSTRGTAAGALAMPSAPAQGGGVPLAPGEPVQATLDAAGNGGRVMLGKGVFVLSAPLRVPSGVTLSGQGLETILILGANFTTGEAALVNADANLHDVTLRDFVVEGVTPVAGLDGPGGARRLISSDPNQDRRQRSHSMAPSRAGIVFSARQEGQMRHLVFEHLTVRHCTHNGVAILGATDVTVAACDFSDNGSSVVPGAGLQHNLLLSRVKECRISDSRMDDSPWGSGVELAFSSGFTITNSEMARNARNGIHLADSHDVAISGILAEGNDRDGIGADALVDGCRQVEVASCSLQNNGLAGIKLDRVPAARLKNNVILGNGSPQ